MRPTKRAFLYPHLKSWHRAVEICEGLSQSGFVAYLAGGCVRDWWLNRQPKDFDVATNAKPEQVAKLFPGSQFVGRAFGVVLVQGVEVATFRRDGPYSDGRHPDHIEFCTAQEDARRRDFTINALFYDLHSGQVIDYVGGLEDLDSRLIRTVGDPEQRFSEDLLRPLRALRFLAQLKDFRLDPGTLQAIKRTASRAQSVAMERVWQEWAKILCSPATARVRSLRLLKQTGWWAQVFPGWFEDLKRRDLFETLWQRHLDLSLPQKLSDQVEVVALMSLSFYDQLLCRWDEGGCEVARKFVRVSIKDWLRKAKVSRQVQEDVAFLLLNLLGFLGLCPFRKADGIRALSEPLGYLLPSMVLGLSQTCQQRERLDEFLSAYHDICDVGGRLPGPFINGNYLLKCGLGPGSRMGEILDELYSLQLEGVISSLQQAQSMALEMVSEGGPVRG